MGRKDIFLPAIHCPPFPLLRDVVGAELRRADVHVDVVLAAAALALLRHIEL